MGIWIILDWTRSDDGQRYAMISLLLNRYLLFFDHKQEKQNIFLKVMFLHFSLIVVMLSNTSKSIR